jgi:YgiT-type zinc finger domain-containing protein
MILDITQCPTCESPRIKRVKKNQRRTFKGKAYVVPNLEYWECPDCGEHVYDHAAMRKIEAHSPAYAKRRAGEKKTAAQR